MYISICMYICCHFRSTLVQALWIWPNFSKSIPTFCTKKNSLYKLLSWKTTPFYFCVSSTSYELFITSPSSSLDRSSPVKSWYNSETAVYLKLVWAAREGASVTRKPYLKVFQKISHTIFPSRPRISHPILRISFNFRDHPGMVFFCKEW